MLGTQRVSSERCGELRKWTHKGYNFVQDSLLPLSSSLGQQSARADRLDHPLRQERLDYSFAHLHALPRHFAKLAAAGKEGREAPDGEGRAEVEQPLEDCEVLPLFERGRRRERELRRRRERAEVGG